MITEISSFDCVIVIQPLFFPSVPHQDDKRNARKEHPKMPSGFQCFVCGKQYATNKESIQHLEEDAHGSMYDTASPPGERILDDFSESPTKSFGLVSKA